VRVCNTNIHARQASVRVLCLLNTFSLLYPDCLFIELDLKRVERAFRRGQPIPGLAPACILGCKRQFMCWHHCVRTRAKNLFLFCLQQSECLSHFSRHSSRKLPILIPDCLIQGAPGSSFKLILSGPKLILPVHESCRTLFNFVIGCVFHFLDWLIKRSRLDNFLQLFEEFVLTPSILVDYLVDTCSISGSFSRPACTAYKLN
jgi:hypothetical protein